VVWARFPLAGQLGEKTVHLPPTSSLYSTAAAHQCVWRPRRAGGRAADETWSQGFEHAGRTAGNLPRCMIQHSFMQMRFPLPRSIAKHSVVWTRVWIHTICTSDISVLRRRITTKERLDSRARSYINTRTECTRTRSQDAHPHKCVLKHTLAHEHLRPPATAVYHPEGEIQSPAAAVHRPESETEPTDAI
jgi:hypothetical protein